MRFLKFTALILMINALLNDSLAEFPGNSEPHFTCVHQDLFLTKQGTYVPIKAYRFAFVNIVDEVCPPFISDYRIPANEINVEDNVVWGEIEHSHSTCSSNVSPECTTPTTDDVLKALCEEEIMLVCQASDDPTGHDCRGGMFY